jgi:hypothetical protein
MVITKNFNGKRYRFFNSHRLKSAAAKERKAVTEHKHFYARMTTTKSKTCNIKYPYAVWIRKRRG